MNIKVSGHLNVINHTSGSCLLIILTVTYSFSRYLSCSGISENIIKKKL